MSNLQLVILWFMVVFGIIHSIRDFLQLIKVKNFLTQILVRRKSKAPGWYWTIFKSSVWISLSMILSIVAIYTDQFYPSGLLALICFFIFELAWFYYWL